MTQKDGLIKDLEAAGWYVTSESIDEFLTENPKLNFQILSKQLLDCDLKNIGAKILSDGVVSGKNETFEAKCILQLAKLRNIGAPKENEHSHSAPPLYKLTLTDGSTNINCLALENIPNLNLNTPPGTKIHLNGSLKIKTNLVILFAKNVKILGGNVDYLVEKWKLTKDLTNHVRKMCMTDSVPPPWVPFGTRQKTQQVDTSKKVFEENKTQEDEESNEFSQARKAIVAEALETKAKTTKTFAQQNIDKNKIIAEISKTENMPTSAPTTKLVTKEQRKGKKGKFRDIENEADYSDKNNTARPPAAATLFEALKTKLNIQDDESPLVASPEPVQRSYEPRGRGRRNQRGQPQRFQQTQQNSRAKDEQVYNPNDFNFDLRDDPKKAANKNETDYIYNPADFEDKKPEQKPSQTKNEFKSSFETNKPEVRHDNFQAQNRNQQKNDGAYRNRANQQFDNRNRAYDNRDAKYENDNYYQQNVPTMTFNRSQNNPRQQQGQYYNRNQNQYYDRQQSYPQNNYRQEYYDERDDYYSNNNNQYYDQQETRYQRNNQFNQYDGNNYNRNQNNSNRRNY